MQSLQLLTLHQRPVCTSLAQLNGLVASPTQEATATCRAHFHLQVTKAILLEILQVDLLSESGLVTDAKFNQAQTRARTKAYYTQTKYAAACTSASVCLFPAIVVGLYLLR